MDSFADGHWTHHLGGIGVALGVGLLVGIEREQDQAAQELRRFGGVRTFGLISLLGALAGLLYPALGVAIVLLVSAIVATALIGTALTEHRQESKPRGLTTEMGALVVLFLGLLATTPIADVTVVQRWGLCAVLALATMSLLSMRQPLHELATRIASADLYATAKLGVLLLVVLPLLPNRQVGPIQHINPFEIGLLVTLIAGIGFIGYAAVRVMGTRKGMNLTAAVGGLVSSTAVTLNFAGRTREDPTLTPYAAVGIGLASTIMYPRMLLEIGVVNPSLVAPASVVLAPMAIAGVAWAALGAFRGRGAAPEPGGPEVVLRNPFSLSQALQFAAIYVVILVMSDYAVRWLGTSGLYISAVLAGATDVDAITLSISRLHREGLATGPALVALLLAATSNAVVKLVLATTLGSRALGLRVGKLYALMAAMGALGLGWAWLLR
jgi:uncharacterized membrane protein (DUF4010 family)